MKPRAAMEEAQPLCRCPARDPRWRDHREMERNPRGAPAVPAQAPDTRLGKPSHRLRLQCPLNATAGGTPSETHPFESSQRPELGEIIVNYRWCFAPVSLEWSVVQQSITRAIQLKFEQFCAPWSLGGLLIFLLVHCGLFPQMLPLSHCAHINSYRESSPMSVPKTKITRIKHLSEYWASGKIYGHVADHVGFCHLAASFPTSSNSRPSLRVLWETKSFSCSEE